MVPGELIRPSRPELNFSTKLCCRWTGTHTQHRQGGKFLPVWADCCNVWRRNYTCASVMIGWRAACDVTPVNPFQGLSMGCEGGGSSVVVHSSSDFETTHSDRSCTELLFQSFFCMSASASASNLPMSLNPEELEVGVVLIAPKTSTANVQN